jgi:glycosyltransferase involved in cell wall biosynthesis
MDNRRLKLGIIFNFRQGWMGGIIYILNVIKMLDFLEDGKKPEVVLFYRPDLKKFIDEIKYPYFKAIEWSFPPVEKGFVKSWLSGKNVFIHKILQDYDLDGLFPMHNYPVRTRTKTKLVAWYADLQHEYYPEFFTKMRLFKRTARIKFILRNSDHLIVSSKAVEDDFRKFFRIRKGLKIHVFHFCSVIDDLKGLNIEDLRLKYKLPSKYFLVSNQFHPHKNHKVLLEAMVLLKEKGISLNYAFTGRFPDEAHSSYLKELHDIINKNNLHDQISFLGVIPRTDQLLLMKHSQGVLQPTLFEGWSTVIEDAISLQVPVVSSNLPVNIEQLGKDGVYFDPFNPSELADILVDYPQRNLQDVFYEEYFARVKNAAEVFVKIFS